MSPDEVLKILRRARTCNRKADVIVGRSIGMVLVNPFLDRPDLVDSIDDEWMVAEGDEWPPLPCFTRSVAASSGAVRRLSRGHHLIDSLQLSDGQFQAILRLPGGEVHRGGIWPSRPLSILGAGFECLMEKR